MIGTVFSIEEFSIYDGPGIRTTVFLKGCPLKCSWCHNPEGQKREHEILKSPNGCLHCGKCERFVKTVDGHKVLTRESIRECPMNLIRECGVDYTPDTLCKKILKNEDILKRNGGITFSGGEPFYQSDFLFECLRLLHGRVNTCIQTSGFCSEKIFSEAMELCDYFLFDIKLADDELHKKYVGASNVCIQNNFRNLAKSKCNFTVRIPLIPVVTDTEDNITNISCILEKNNVDYAELLPYNKMAGSKYSLCMREFKPDFDPECEVSFRNEIFEKFGIKIKIL